MSAPAALGPQPGAAIAVETSVDVAEWDAYVATHARASLYHGQAFRRVFERAFGHRCHYLATRRDGRICGVLPLVEFDSRLFGRFAVSLPFVNVGGVLADDDSAADTLGRHALALSAERRWAYLEMRHTSALFPGWPSRRHKVGMTRRLPERDEELWQGLDRKVRNLVRKAEKAGCSVVSGQRELLGDFYRVFAHNMRDLGTPVYARRFFAEVLDAAGGAARVFVVRDGGEPVAAALTLRWREAVEVPWASSLRAYAAKAPNMLLYWALLRDAIGRGARVFDFGRSTPGEGTFHFKRQWGAEPHPLVWEYPGLTGRVPDHSPGNPKFRLAITAWQKLPVRVATLIGPHIVRNIP